MVGECFGHCFISTLVGCVTQSFVSISPDTLKCISHIACANNVQPLEIWLSRVWFALNKSTSVQNDLFSTSVSKMDVFSTKKNELCWLWSLLFFDEPKILFIGREIQNHNLWNLKHDCLKLDWISKIKFSQEGEGVSKETYSMSFPLWRLFYSHFIAFTSSSFADFFRP